jgi:hypothetical protein
MMTQVPKSYVATASQSQRYSADVCLHLSHLALCTSPSLNRCSFKSWCPVSSPASIPSWFLLKLSNAPALSEEGLLRKPLACLCPWMDCYYYACFLFIHPLITSLPIMADMPSAGSRPVSGREESYLSSYLISQTVWKITVPSASFEDEGNTIPWNVSITHPATWHHIPAELDLQNHCCENLKFGMMLLVWQHTTHTISYFCTFVLVTGYAWVNVQSASYRTHALFLPVILKWLIRSTWNA